MAGLDALYAPRSVAVVGVNDSEVNLGYGILRSLSNGGYTGEVFPISRRLPSIRGLETHRSVTDIERPPDLVVIALPAELVNPVVEDSIRAGARSILVLSSGFAEGGHADRQDNLRRSKAGTSVRIAGPNCAGYTNFVDATIVSSPCPFGPEAPRPRVGPIGIVSQSGGVGFYLMRLLSAAGLGLNWQISTGNEVDVDVSEATLYLLEKPEVAVVLCFCETISHPERFIEAASRAADLDKPMAVLKGGRTAPARRAAMSHTASLAGSEAVFDSVCRQFGIHVARSFDDLVNFGRIFSNRRRARTPNAGVVTATGGVGVLLADALTVAGLSIPDLSDEGASPWRDAIDTGAMGSLTNPVDVGTGGGDSYANALRWLSESPSLDLVVPVITNDAPPLADLVLNCYKDTDRPFAILSTGSPSACTVATLVRQDVPVFIDPGGLALALSALVEQSRRGPFLRSAPTEPTEVDVVTIRTILARAAERPFLLENDSADILRTLGIAVAEAVFATTADEAVAAAEWLSGPVALKIMSYLIPHKSDVGGVMLGVEGPEAVRDGFNRLINTVALAVPDAALEGVLVQRMVPGRLELACGIQKDDIFGPIVMVTLGGTLIEISASSAMLLPPFGPDQARAAIASLLEGRLVSGSRGLQPDELAGLADVMCRLADLAAMLPEIHSVDVNPICVADGGVVAADALIIRRPAPDGS
jgi:acetyltransferase